jgi:hypothetical protein
VSDVDPEIRARAMTRLPERDRNVLIALGVMQRNVIDARRRFDPDFGLPDYWSLPVGTVITETDFGPFFPGDVG